MRYNPGTFVYIYGLAEAVAIIIEADSDGAIVRECDDLSETWFSWDDLTAEPNV